MVTVRPLADEDLPAAWGLGRWRAAPAGLLSGPGDPSALDLLASGPPARLLDHS